MLREAAVKVLLIKTSSLGDIVHAFPALTDAVNACPDIEFDWVVEEAFADIAALHPAVSRVLPCALRRWRKAPLKTWRSGEWRDFKQALQASHYDVVIDAQGLIKSAFITRLTRGERVGLDSQSAREGLSAKALDRPLAVPKGEHAITRLRQLFAQALNYPLPTDAPESGFSPASALTPENAKQLIFLHGTTWPTKHWPEKQWRQLATLASAAGTAVWLPWGNEEEKARAERIADGLAGVSLLAKMSLADLFKKMLQADGFVAVDTGLAHLAAAAGLSGVALYGPTDPRLTGVLGVRARSLSADFPCAPCVQERCTYKGDLGKGFVPPCFSSLPAELVWRELFAERP
jgi:heptosyltransferase-1